MLLETRTVDGCHMELVNVFLQLCSKSYNHLKQSDLPGKCNGEKLGMLNEITDIFPAKLN